MVTGETLRDGYSYPVLSSKTVIIPEVAQQPMKIAVSFDTLKVADKPACTNQPVFVEKVQPLMKQNCVDCHTTNVAAHKAFPIAMNDSLCWQSEERLANNLWHSPLVTYPMQGLYGHPLLAKEVQTPFLKSLQDWTHTR